MKISELTTKEFLSNPGAVANSYVLINYEDSTTEAPVTYKATVDELGKAIANNLQLYKADNNGNAYTMGVSQGAYTNNAAKQFVTAAEKTKIANALTQHQDISGKVDKVTGKGLSTNDYTDADKLKVSHAISGSMASIAASVAKETIHMPATSANSAHDFNYVLFSDDDRLWTFDPTLNSGAGKFWPIEGMEHRYANAMVGMEVTDNAYQFALVDKQGGLGWMVYDAEANGQVFTPIETGGGGSGSGSGSSAPPSNCFYVYDPPEGEDDDHLPLQLRRSGSGSGLRLSNEILADGVTVGPNHTLAMFVVQDSNGQFYGYAEDCGAMTIREIDLPVPYEKRIKHYESEDSVWQCVFYGSTGCFSALMTLDKNGSETAIPPLVYDTGSSLTQPMYITTQNEVGYFNTYGNFTSLDLDDLTTLPLEYHIENSTYRYAFVYGDGLYSISESGAGPVAAPLGSPLFYTKDTTNNKLLLKDINGNTIGQVDLIASGN